MHSDPNYPAENGAQRNLHQPQLISLQRNKLQKLHWIPRDSNPQAQSQKKVMETTQPPETSPVFPTFINVPNSDCISDHKTSQVMESLFMNLVLSLK